MILPMEASPAPSKLAFVKALGLTQQIAFMFAHVPLNSMDCPATVLPRRAIPTPLEPAFTVAVAVRGAPVWKCMIPLKDHPFTRPPSTPVRCLPHGDSIVKLEATMCVASKLNLP